MNRRPLFLSIVAVAGLGLLGSSARAADPPARMLFVTQSAGFKHGPVTRRGSEPAPAEKAMTELGSTSGLFRVDCTQDVAKDFTKDNLANYDIVMFYTTGPKNDPDAKKNLPISDEMMEQFLGNWLKHKGHGFIGAHSAADTYADYKPYWDMLGGSFNGHPWGANSRVTITVHDTRHPVSKPWGTEFEITDEIYQFKNWQPEKVHVLMSLDMAKTALKKPYLVPIAWCKDYGEGKAVHMSLGHNNNVWTNEKYMQSMLGAVKWILNLEPGDATPNPDLSAKLETKAKADFDAAQKGK